MKKIFKDRIEYVNKAGELHREDGPAFEYFHGSKQWYRNGQRHREDGPAAEYADGTKYWFRNGQRHREDGPAAEDGNGNKYWYRNGQRHREDGPAVERFNKRNYWFLDDVEVKCFKYNEDEVCKEICLKCKRNTKDGCIGGLKHCPFMMEQIVCKRTVEKDP